MDNDCQAAKKTKSAVKKILILDSETVCPVISVSDLKQAELKVTIIFTFMDKYFSANISDSFKFASAVLCLHFMH